MSICFYKQQHHIFSPKEKNVIIQTRLQVMRNLLVHGKSNHSQYFIQISIREDALSSSVRIHRAYPCRIYLFPLVDVANESGEAQQPQQTEDLGEADNPQGSGRFVKV